VKFSLMLCFYFKTLQQSGDKKFIQKTILARLPADSQDLSVLKSPVKSVLNKLKHSLIPSFIEKKSSEYDRECKDF